MQVMSNPQLLPSSRGQTYEPPQRGILIKKKIRKRLNCDVADPLPNDSMDFVHKMRSRIKLGMTVSEFLFFIIKGFSNPTIGCLLNFNLSTRHPGLDPGSKNMSIQSKSILWTMSINDDEGFGSYPLGSSSV